MVVIPLIFPNVPQSSVGILTVPQLPISFGKKDRMKRGYRAAVRRQLKRRTIALLSHAGWMTKVHHSWNGVTRSFLSRSEHLQCLEDLFSEGKGLSTHWNLLAWWHFDSWCGRVLRLGPVFQGAEEWGDEEWNEAWDDEENTRGKWWPVIDGYAAMSNGLVIKRDSDGVWKMEPALFDVLQSVRRLVSLCL